jgi:hypothetical protein
VFHRVNLHRPAFAAQQGQADNAMLPTSGGALLLKERGSYMDDVQDDAAGEREKGLPCVYS